MTGVGILCFNLLSLLDARLTVFFLIEEMDLFGLIRAPNPTKVKTGSRPQPPTVRESRKRGPEGVDANAPPKSLRRDHTDRPSGVPDDVSDPDPLAFTGAPSHPPVDVAQYVLSPCP
uniref:Uncharacterized protein n=1 Tax=Tanacetum cinerariifolium TaxID=118510 RepID=A0A699TV71_TANCI|nr:hypothetical protein [Tanacetum cinerariifolium]